MLIVLLAVVFATMPTPSHSQQIIGNVSAVYDLIERVLPGTSSHFALTIVAANNTKGMGFTMMTQPDGTLSIAATSASELTSGLGMYLRDWCNMTIGWPRGGGSNVFVPAVWPAVTVRVTQVRAVPWSYIMNVCTHSYSLVWYTWAEWTVLIDWMALSGINLALAMTGQEEVQYKVFEALGLSDTDIRTWFNGPAFLTWSRGQNEYGNNIAGPLPRSWMKAQWDLQRQILARYRSLGIVGQLPGFQGNVPWKLAALLGDPNITQEGDTGWFDSLDPQFNRVADMWMQTLLADFGTDHWYQLDGYFDGGTAPWMRKYGLATCTYSAVVPNTYLAGCSRGCAGYATIALAEAACNAASDCGGITKDSEGKWELRASSSPVPSTTGESSVYITNPDKCRISPYELWKARGANAYMGLNKTDPEAIWSFQGWAIIGWHTPVQAASFKGFVDAVPKDKFVVIDMSVNGEGEWRMWNDASFFGAPFIWTTLHDFGGTDGMKGDLARINRIPFDGLNGVSTVIGTGYTPEGIDQNPVYYEFMAQQNFRTSPVPNITSHIITRSHRRYGLSTPNADVAAAWALLVSSAYAEDLSVQDGTGIPHLPGSDTAHFLPDLHTPTQELCQTFQAWTHMMAASSAVSPTLETFRYDLVNLARELLAQLSTPMSKNFSDAIGGPAPLDVARITDTGSLYISLLQDVDALVGTDSAFLLGPWITSARSWAANNSDCDVKSCGDFYEWNARTQLTTWNPTPKGAAVIPDGPIDYASKHWNGLIGDYYAVRASKVLALALTDAAAGRRLNQTAVDAMEADLAYTWTNAVNVYPSAPTGSALDASAAMYAKYKPYFASC